MRLLLTAIVMSLALSVFAAQDDAVDVSRHPDFLFHGNEENKTNFLSDKALRSGFGVYFMGDEFHAFQFKAGVEIGVFSFGKDLLWRMGFTMEGLADGQSPDFWFRLVQTFYDVSTDAEWRLGDGVFVAGWRHRCRHGSDQVPSRIVMRSGPEFAYNHLFHIAPVNLVLNNTLNIFVVGQNDDFLHHPKASIASVLQVELPVYGPLTLFASGGGAISFITGTDAKNYTIMTPETNFEVQFSPTGALGISVAGKVGEFRTYLSYHTNLDAGFRDRAQPIHALSLLGEYWL